MKGFLVLVFLFPMFLFSQEFGIEGEVGTKIIVTNKDDNPFWFHTNTNYGVGPLTNLSVTAQINASLNYSTFKINAGGCWQRQVLRNKRKYWMVFPQPIKTFYGPGMPGLCLGFYWKPITLLRFQKPLLLIGE